jgi:hypothetical protein
MGTAARGSHKKKKRERSCVQVKKGHYKSGIWKTSEVCGMSEVVFCWVNKREKMGRRRRESHQEKSPLLQVYGDHDVCMYS